MDTGAIIGIAAVLAAVLLLRRSSEDDSSEVEYSNDTEYEVVMPTPSYDRSANLSAFLWYTRVRVGVLVAFAWALLGPHSLSLWSGCLFIRGIDWTWMRG